MATPKCTNEEGHSFRMLSGRCEHCNELHMIDMPKYKEGDTVVPEWDYDAFADNSRDITEKILKRYAIHDDDTEDGVCVIKFESENAYRGGVDCTNFPEYNRGMMIVLIGEHCYFDMSAMNGEYSTLHKVTNAQYVALLQLVEGAYPI